MNTTTDHRTKNYEFALLSLCRVAFSPDQKYGNIKRHELFPIVSSLASELADMFDFNSRQIPYIANRVAERIGREYNFPVYVEPGDADDDCSGCGWTLGTCQCNQPEISDRAECDL